MRKHRRPWGHYEVLHKEKGMLVKKLVVNPGKRISLQRHFLRSEAWAVIEGRGTLTLKYDGLTESRFLFRGDSETIRVGMVHRLTNGEKAPLVVIETQIGENLSENDIERLEDDYGRK